MRTCFVFVFVLGFAALAVPREQIGVFTRYNLFWLGLSGVVVVILAWLVLGERITPRVAFGKLLILPVCSSWPVDSKNTPVW